eukprot:6198929-Pleurochrysis_carterae.AAC.3
MNYLIQPRVDTWHVTSRGAAGSTSLPIAFHRQDLQLKVIPVVYVHSMKHGKHHTSLSDQMTIITGAPHA